MIASTNLLLAAGSADAILATGGLLRILGNSKIPTIFTQAHTVNTIDVTKWEPGRNIVFVDLAVNNQNPQMTQDFVDKIHKAGHKILGIADEHNREDWKQIMGEKYDTLAIKPVSRSEEVGSASAVLKKTFANQIDKATMALFDAGNAADQGDFTSYFANLVNCATKSNIQDQDRRSYIASYLAETADEKISGWFNEYVELEKNLSIIVAARQDKGDGIFFYDGSKMRHDATSLMMSEYKIGAGIVVLRTKVFVQGKGMVDAVSIGTGNKTWNLQEHFAKSGVASFGGFASKMNFPLDQEEAAIEAVRTLVKSEKK